MTLHDALVDALARIVFAREAVELKEYALASSILRDLEQDWSRFLNLRAMR